MPSTRAGSASSAEDDGMAHYRLLGLPRSASQDDIKRAYRRLARARHPDKGGSTQGFAALQAAFETLSNPKARAAYDALAADARFRPGAAAPRAHMPADPFQPPPPPPGVAEAALLQQLLRRCLASSTDPATQLCNTCEVCRRPATQECWTCGMHICDFCTRRQHWKGEVSLHWPLVDSPGRLVEQLGRQELERKRKEDGQAHLMRQPGYRPASEVQVLRQFQDAIFDALAAAPAAAFVAAGNDGTAPAASTAAAAASETLSPSLGAPHSSTTSSSSMFAISAGAASIARAAQPPAAALPPAKAPAAAGSAGALATADSSSSSSSSSGGGIISMRAPRSSGNQNRCFRAWAAAAPEAISQLMTRYDIRLARFYKWAQTDSFLLLALHLPTGGTSHPPKLDIQASSSSLRVQHQGFAPVLSRAWAGRVDAAAGLTTWVASDGQLLGLVVPKAVPGEVWTACFKGDSHGARCLCSPYLLLQLPQEVQLELELPFWVDPAEDVQVVLGQQSLTVAVDGLLRLERRYWSDESQAARVVDTAASSWDLTTQADDDGHSAGGAGGAAAAGTRRAWPGKLLSITLALPGPTEEELLYKNGVRQNNAAAVRRCSHGAGKQGRAFFADDEDEFGLAPLLQALQMHVAGRAWLAPKPWEVAAGAVVAAAAPAAMPTAAAVQGGGGAGGVGRWTAEADCLPRDAQQLLRWIQETAEAGSI